MTQNEINYQRLIEDQRHNVASETETNRANLAGEGLRRDELIETNRSNVVRETETARANRAKEEEDRRSHLASEQIARQNAWTAYGNLLATQQHYNVSDQYLSTHYANQDYVGLLNANASLEQAHASTKNADTREKEYEFGFVEEEGRNKRSRLDRESREKVEATKADNDFIKSIGSLFQSVVPLITAN